MIGPEVPVLIAGPASVQLFVRRSAPHGMASLPEAELLVQVC